MELNLLGLNISINRSVPLPAEVVANRSLAQKGLEILKDCVQGHTDLDKQIVENEDWYRARHWEIMRGKASNKNRPEPVTMYLFNILANKHADAMDNYPKGNFLPRSNKADESEAKLLTEVIPSILDYNGYYKVYNDAWWYKLKHGFVIKTVLWDAEKHNGIGDIQCGYIDKLNCAWDRGATSLKKSRNFFIFAEENTEEVKEMFPGLKIGASKEVQPLKYADNPQKNDADTTLIVDWYFKKRVNGRKILCFCKIVGGEVAYYSENDPDHPEYKENGFYDDNEFPAYIDVLFPHEGTPVGFGFIAIAKNPQMYIDKLDQIISENALMVGRKRWFRKGNGENVVNMEQFKDWSQPFVDVNGSLEDTHLREIKTEPLPVEIPSHRQAKVQELKDITSNDVFNSGSGGKGVTAAAAIYALQEAGNKVSRDMNKMTYESYREEMNMVIARLRQMYNVTRTFRIDLPNGQYDFRDFDNSGLRPQQYAPMYEGQAPQYRIPEFDIKVSAEKSNPYSTMVMNEMAQGMMGAGFFAPQNAEPALIALEMMSFEGKEKVMEQIKQNSAMYQQFQQMQAALVKLAGAAGMIQPGGQNSGMVAQGAQNGQRQILS